MRDHYDIQPGDGSERPEDEQARRAGFGTFCLWLAFTTAYAWAAAKSITNPSDREDFVQEVIIAAWLTVAVTKTFTTESDDAEDRRDDFKVWLSQIVKHKLSEYRRRMGRQARMESIVGAVGLPDKYQAHQDALHALLSTELGRRTLHAVDCLSPSDAEVVTLKVLAGMKWVQIATLLDEPVNTVTARGHRAFKKLRRLVADETFYPESDQGDLELGDRE